MALVGSRFRRNNYCLLVRHILQGYWPQNNLIKFCKYDCIHTNVRSYGTGYFWIWNLVTMLMISSYQWNFIEDFCATNMTIQNVNVGTIQDIILPSYTLKIFTVKGQIWKRTSCNSTLTKVKDTWCWSLWKSILRVSENAKPICMHSPQ